MGGAQFASDRLESEDRSAVQHMVNPFIEKMIIEAVLEARREESASCCKGSWRWWTLMCNIRLLMHYYRISMDVSKVHTRGAKMLPHEIMENLKSVC